MKNLIAAILVAITLSNVAIADCDFSKVVHNADGTMTYTKELHICVGQMKQDLDTAQFQLGEYKKAIDLKDLALTAANTRSDLWMNASFKLQDRMNTIEDMKFKNQLLIFVAGVAFTSLAVWGAGHLVSK